ncbi:MAG: hypothetical protein AUH33_05705 [Chloroflexi bacterium 13_1_40CM_68_21]|nr:MAG: hypothetical protein AUH33_05705 [Chloroflexi bacterium 13_1_40CM_68_21]
MVRSVEALYGPPRWARGEWQNEPGIARPRTKIAAAPLRPLVLRTLVTVTVALFAWYAFLGGAASLRSAASFALNAAGLVRPNQTAPVTAEYLLAVRTVGDASTLAPTDPFVLQLKGLLDEMSPKCREDRYAVAAAVIAAHDALVGRGLEASSVSILIAANATLSEQTRRSWPTSCGDVIQRIVAGRTAAH